MATYKDSVRASTTSDITLSGRQSIDGVSLKVGDRVLVKDQTTDSQNGIYTVSDGVWPRAKDADKSDWVTAETTVRVSEGTANGHTEWSLAAQGSITLDTTPLRFVQQRTAANQFGLYGMTIKPMADTDQTLSAAEAGKS